MTGAEVLRDDGDPSQSAYEELRGLAVAGAGAAGRLGVVILLREGLAAWVARRGIGADAIEIAPQHRRAGGPALSEEIHRSLVRVLASMVLGGDDKETSA